jgi:hypothetical protein
MEPGRGRAVISDPGNRNLYPVVRGCSLGFRLASFEKSPERTIGTGCLRLRGASGCGRVRWASHDVRQYRSGTQPFHHPLVGDLTLSYEALRLTADVGLTLIVYTADPDSPSQEALNRLASWSSAPDRTSR